MSGIIAPRISFVKSQLIDQDSFSFAVVISSIGAFSDFFNIMSPEEQTKCNELINRYEKFALDFCYLQCKIIESS